MRKPLAAVLSVTLSLAGIIHPASGSKIAATDGLIVVGSGSGKLALYWYKVPGAKSYLIYRNTSLQRKKRKPPVLIAKIRKAQDSYVGSLMKLWVDQKVVNGQQYFYTVKAVDSHGKHSAASEEMSEVADHNSVPWASRDARLIIRSVMSSPNPTNPGSNTIGQQDFITIGGPDGYIYEKTPKGGYSGHKPEPVTFPLPTA
ncbi:hypothetical protein EON80_04860 [bacterium]|nr:MAG: hypothetical protein EON80_04860 [bacterium]